MLVTISLGIRATTLKFGKGLWKLKSAWSCVNQEHTNQVLLLMLGLLLPVCLTFEDNLEDHILYEFSQFLNVG